MKIRKSIVVAAAAVAFGTTGGLAAPALAASGHCTQHTLKFTSVTTGETRFSKTIATLQATVVNSAGKDIGFDLIYETLMPNKTATLTAAIGINGGLLYATAKTTNGGVTFSGRVTGGTGVFRGAFGTISTEAISVAKAAVTITYR
jgi:hypothetical protein